MSKAMKKIYIITKLTKSLHSLVTIYKAFVRLHLDYGDMMTNQICNEGFCQKNERIQYNAAFVIIGPSKGLSQNKLYNVLGFKTLRFTCWFIKSCTFNKIKETGVPKYLLNFIPQSSHLYNAFSLKNLQHFIGTSYIARYQFTITKLC